MHNRTNAALMQWIHAVVAKLPEAPPGDPPPPPRRRSPEESFMAKLGTRHHGATLDNFIASTPEAKAALATLRQYADDLASRITHGQNILITGPAGTGKDHLLIGLAKIAARRGHTVSLTTGPILYRTMRDAMHAHTETDLIDALIAPDILILSDPLPPIGALTAHQAAILYDIVDTRWQQRRPIWASLNVANQHEANTRLGAPIVDRLHDGALVIRATWPSHRKPQTII